MEGKTCNGVSHQLKELIGLITALQRLVNRKITVGYRGQSFALKLGLTAEVMPVKGPVKMECSLKIKSLKGALAYLWYQAYDEKIRSSLAYSDILRFEENLNSMKIAPEKTVKLRADIDNTKELSLTTFTTWKYRFASLTSLLADYKIGVLRPNLHLIVPRKLTAHEHEFICQGKI